MRTLFFSILSILTLGIAVCGQLTIDATGAIKSLFQIRNTYNFLLDFRPAQSTIGALDLNCGRYNLLPCAARP